MKKILLAFDGRHFSEAVFEFARVLNEKRRILLTGVFLPEVDYAMLSDYTAGGIVGSISIPLVEKYSKTLVQSNIEKFELLCNENLIEFKVHNEFIEFAIPELVKETVFADLLLIGSESFYKNLGTREPNQYLEETLHRAACPIVVVPEKFNFPQTNVLAYDGSESCVFAIKQFAYLFPDLTANPTILVHIDEHGETRLPEQDKVEELLYRHFHDLTIYKFHDDPNKHFNDWLSKRNHPILIAGSYARSGLSRLFHKSFVTNVIQDHRMPVFTAHHK